MFDVDWSDPNRESVGDRRARKKRDKEKRRDGEEDGHSEDQAPRSDEHEGDSSRASESLRSSMSSVDKQFGFFGAKQRRKGNSLRKGKSKSVASSSLRASTIDEQLQTEPGLALFLDNRKDDRTGESGQLDLPSSFCLSFTGSVLNRLDEIERAPGGSLLGCDITNPQPGLITAFQELGDGVSMVTKTIDTALRRCVVEDSEFLVSTVAISAEDDDLQLAKTCNSKSSSSSTRFKTASKFDASKERPQFVEVVRPLPSTSNLPSSNKETLDEANHLPVIAEDTNTEQDESNHHQYKRRFRPRLSAPPITPASQKPTDNADTWKAPQDWATSPSEDGTTGGAADLGTLDGTVEVSSLTLDITHMQRELDQMINASPQIILQRLKDTWGRYKLDGEPPTAFEENPELDEGLKIMCDEAERALDAALGYKEREMENKRWLLSILNNMEAILESDVTLSPPPVELKSCKVLALFEAQATASYIASVNHSIPVYHLSSDPLSHKRYPNIHPVVCPAVSASVLSLAPSSFSTISCLPITSILPSAEIPKLLEKMHGALVPGGCLQMMMIDPWPLAESLGPKLQEWLDDNLIFNLELQFRCLRPSRMFPVWLQDARLRASGSTITTTRFQAVAQGRDNASNRSGRSRDSAQDEVEIKKELGSMAGRLLWQEIWGSFVTGEQWWWDDAQIVEECIQMETCWEYCIVAACKQDGRHDGDGR